MEVLKFYAGFLGIKIDIVKKREFTLKLIYIICIEFLHSKGLHMQLCYYYVEMYFEIFLNL